MKIVIVENEIRIREGLCKLIGRMKHNYEVVQLASDGIEGMEKIKEYRPELVITDIRMPKLDGLEMLERLYKENIKFKTIVVSAYSEFSYAQKAIKLGVSEYLIKPIRIGDLSKALYNIEMQFEVESANNPDTIGSLEAIVSGVMIGSVNLNEDISVYLRSKYNFYVNHSISELLIYLGDLFEEEKERVKRNLKRMIQEQAKVGFCIFEIVREKMIIVVLYGYKSAEELEKWFRDVLFKRNNIMIPKEACGAWINMNSLKELRESHLRIKKYLDWNIILGNEVMISYPKITHIQTVPCVYPIELENDIRIALCESDNVEIYKIIESFINYFNDGSIYEPNEVKESIVRFVWAIIGIMKELGKLDSSGIKQQELLENIMDAVSFEEIKSILNNFYIKITENTSGSEVDTSLTVLRAKSMIDEYFKEGITLEEISNKLNVTPEYLGTQFHKELSINFSTYIKNCRIKKAKKLLIGTQLKLLEIAKKVGYSDPKYFSKVFKNVTGMLPSQYRKFYK